MIYFKTATWVLKKLYPQRIWSMPVRERVVYLTFDDGPNPLVTHFVLDELLKYNAKATFFCIGKNVVDNPLTYKRILDEGHTTGNHTYDHLNGFKTGDEEYLENIYKAKEVIDSNMFRPPYGRMTKFQEQQLSGNKFNLKTIMWSVLSGDFDTTISGERCLRNVLRNVSNGSIVVFHDSEKASERLVYALPKLLNKLSEEGYQFKKLEV